VHARNGHYFHLSSLKRRDHRVPNSINTRKVRQCAQK